MPSVPVVTDLNFLPFIHRLAVDNSGIRFDYTGRVLELFDESLFTKVFMRSTSTFSRRLTLRWFES